MLRFCQMQIPTKSSAGENRLADLCTVGPDSDLRRKQAGESGASADASNLYASTHISVRRFTPQLAPQGPPVVVALKSGQKTTNLFSTPATRVTVQTTWRSAQEAI